MANKEYVAIFVPPAVRAAIKDAAKAKGRTMILELAKRYKVKEELISV